jgi:hypothetical protein
MKYRACIISLGLGFVIFSGCSSDSNKTVQPEPQAGDTLFVSVANSGGFADGTAAHPYGTIGAAVAASRSGQTIYILEGSYGPLETFPIYLKSGISLSGVGKIFTIVNGGFADSTAHSSDPIKIQHLSFEALLFGRGAALDTPSVYNIVNDCNVTGDLAINHGGGHNFKIENTQIVGSIHVSHGAGSSVNVIKNNIVQGSINLEHGNSLADTVSGNVINGGNIYDRSGICNTVISDNTVNDGKILDSSGAGLELIEGNTITFTPSDTTEIGYAFICNGSSVTARHNTITSHGTAGGMIFRSGAPTLIDSNTVSVEGRAECIGTLAGQGHLLGNQTTGGLYGIFDRSGATQVAFNIIMSADTGVFTQSLAKYEHNTISNCTGVGMVLDGVRGPIEDNAVFGSGAAGVILFHAVDLGGGADSCIGGNSFTGNGGFDLVNLSADTIEAKYNHWDHNSALDIDAIDIYDSDEDSTVGPVNFEPFE